MHDSSIPVGLCQCGCGEKTNLAPHDLPKLGLTKDQPRRFVAGHQNRVTLPPPNPSGLCQCGCGQRAPVATQTSRRHGWAAGQSLRFIVGHRGRIPDHLLPDVQPNHSGLCMCGCGQATAIATKTDRKHGYVKGEPRRFRRGHDKRILVRWLPEDRGYYTPCEIWQLAPDDKGYGCERRDGKNVKAHRQRWIDAYGPIDPALDVCHHCDVPACGNLDHLFLGTRAENMADCARKGRTTRGERNPHAQLTWGQVREMRALLADGARQCDVARLFDITSGSMSMIARGLQWREE